MTMEAFSTLSEWFIKLLGVFRTIITLRLIALAVGEFYPTQPNYYTNCGVNSCGHKSRICSQISMLYFKPICEESVTSMY